jgi:AraC-like DNA-binding protein
MLGEGLDAASVAYRVGYDDASHFNREYKRLFGQPPMRDVERLREAAGNGVAPLDKRIGIDQSDGEVYPTGLATEPIRNRSRAV